MKLKKYLDAVNTASGRVTALAAQIDEHFEAGETEKALELRPQLDAAKLDYEKANQLYLSMLNATTVDENDPGRHIAQATAVQVIQDEGDKPFSNDGEFLLAVKVAAQYPGRTDPRLQPLKVKDATGMSEGVPAEGGYLLQPQTASGLIENMYSTGDILTRISSDPVGPNSNGMTYNGVDETSRANGSRKGGIVAGWIGEGGTLPSGKPKFRQVELKLRKLGALCYATDEQLQDTVNLQSWITRNVPEEMRFVTEDAIYEGIGGGMPLGIMNSPCLVSVTRTDANKIQYADVIAMWARRYTGVRDYVWLTNQDATPQLDQLVLSGTANTPTRFIDYGPDGVMLMKGKPVIEVEYAATLGTTGDLMLASLSQYQAISKTEMQMASSIHVQFLTDEMAFRFIWRFDGKPLWHSAVTPLHGSATVSPFVVLTTSS